jgi:Terpene synthase family 2, C-terminal metal binding
MKTQDECFLKKIIYHSEIPFLRARKHNDLDHIFCVSKDLSEKLILWASHHHYLRRKRILPLAIGMAASMPFVSVDDLTSIGKLNLWIFGIDDIVDEWQGKQKDLFDFINLYKSVLLDPKLELDITPSQKRKRIENVHERSRINLFTTADCYNEVSLALKEILNDLAHYPLFQSLKSIWQDSIFKTISAMEKEQKWKLAYKKNKSKAILPTLHTYMKVGFNSIGAIPHMWSSILTMNDISIFEHFHYLQKIEHLASATIRLANDLQSFDREKREGKFNSVTIVAQHFESDGDYERSIKTAKEYIAQLIHENLTLLNRLCSKKITLTGYPESSIFNCSQFTCDFYSLRDFS